MNINNLLNSLDDRFEMLPMQMALSSLSEAMVEADKEFLDSLASRPASRKYWHVETEILYETKGLIIGNSFVLAQVLITQAVSLINRIDKLLPSINLEKQKQKLICSSSRSISNTSVSEINLIDAVANYFKHHHEWSGDWDLDGSSSSQKKTIKVLNEVSIFPSELTSNMEKSMGLLNLDGNVAKLCTIIEDWREALSNNIKFIVNA